MLAVEVPAPSPGSGEISDGAGAKDLTGADRLQRFAIVILIWAAKRRDRGDSQIDPRRCGAE